jgi:hypothetical protein
MTYALHITRAEKWSENTGQEIGAEEWQAVIDSDPELLVHPINGPAFAIWIRPGKGPHGWIDWERGNLLSSQPNHALLRKMLAIAKKLGAKVQGDDGEPYESVADLDE